MTSKISLVDKLDLVSEHPRPKVIAALNGPEIKIIQILGEFHWHPHDHEGEFFMVWCRAGSSIAPVPTKKPEFCVLSLAGS